MGKHFAMASEDIITLILEEHQGPYGHSGILITLIFFLYLVKSLNIAQVGETQLSSFLFRSRICLSVDLTERNKFGCSCVYAKEYS